MTDEGAASWPDAGATPEQQIPRFYGNFVNIAVAAYDVTFTFVDKDFTDVPEHVLPEMAWRTNGVIPTCQVVMSVAHAKAMIPLIVKGIADYEQKFGVIPAPGFDESSKG